MKSQEGEARRLMCREWYSGKMSAYESLTKIACGTIEGLLKEKQIDHLSVTGRAKSLDGLLEKMQRKEYSNPKTDVHDLAGIRVITYIESDVEKAVHLVRSAFNVHPDKSLDKTTELGVDRIGYRSVHLVCDFGASRASLPEYAPYEGMLLEVQIRTVLQHAWAEIEHDRNYKFGGVLPARIERRLHLAAGTLEMVDYEFDALAKAIDEHSRMVAHETKKGNLDIPIDTPGLEEFMRTKFQGEDWVNLSKPRDFEVVPELKRFGLTTLAEVDALLTPTLLTATKKEHKTTTGIGLLRAAMMYSDIVRYFTFAWQHSWKGMDEEGVRVLELKYPAKKLNTLLNKHNIDIFPYLESEHV